jgi:cytochrome P450
MSSERIKPYSDIPAPPLQNDDWRTHALRFTLDPLTVMNELKAYGNVVALVQGGNGALMFPGEDCPGTIFVFGADLNRQILTRTDDFHSGPIIGPIYSAWKDDPRLAVLKRVGTGLFSLNGEAHQRQRRLIQPAFHRKQIELYARNMIEIAGRTVQKWEVGQRLDFQREMFDHTLLVAGKCLFGQDFGDATYHIGNLIQRWLELIPLVAVEAPADDYEAFFKVSRQIDDQIRSIISLKRSGVGEGQDVLAELVRVRDDAGDVLTEDELIGHINILLTAGHETTANVLSWTVFLLAQHPDVMRLVYEELDRVLCGSALSIDKLSDLVFLDDVIRESMRVFPPVTIGSRVTSHETNLLDYHLPKGTEVVFSHYHTHHDPVLYEEPSRFIPQRWSAIQPTPYEYLPFSAGVKMCIGAPFALMEIKITLAMLLQRFRFKVVGDSVIQRHVWVPLRPDHMPLVVCEQDGCFEDSSAVVGGSILEMVSF